MRRVGRYFCLRYLLAINTLSRRYHMIKVILLIVMGALGSSYLSFTDIRVCRGLVQSRPIECEQIRRNGARIEELGRLYTRVVDNSTALETRVSRLHPFDGVLLDTAFSMYLDAPPADRLEHEKHIGEWLTDYSRPFFDVTCSF